MMGKVDEIPIQRQEIYPSTWIYFPSTSELDILIIIHKLSNNINTNSYFRPIYLKNTVVGNADRVCSMDIVGGGVKKGSERCCEEEGVAIAEKRRIFEV